MQAARAIALPASDNHRLASVWDRQPVALNNPFSVLPCDYTKSYDVDYFKPGSFICGVSRDPLRSLVYYVQNASGALWSYQAQWFSINTFDAPQTSFVGNSLILNWQGGPTGRTPLKPMSLLPTTTNQLFGPAQYAAADKGDSRRYFWIDAKQAWPTTVTFRIYTDPGLTTGWSGPAGAEDVGIAWEMYPQNPASDTTNLFPTGADEVTFTFLEPGFYTFDIVNTNYNSASTPLYLTMSVSGKSSGFRFDAIPGLVERAPDVQALLTLGASVMVSPAATTMAEGGRVFGMQVPEKQLWGSFFDLTLDNISGTTPTASCTAQICRLNGNKGLDLRGGMYAWHRPVTERCVGWAEPFTFDNTMLVTTGALGNKPFEVLDMCGQLQPPGGWSVIAVDGAPSPLNSTGTASFPSMSFLLTTNYSLNTATTSSWYHIEPPVYAIAVNELPTLLASIPNHVENPLHWGDITSWISNNATKIISAAKAVGGAIIGAVAPEALPAYSAVAALV